MPDMYDKLGELLSEVLESGGIPQNKSEKVCSTEDRNHSIDNSVDHRNDSGPFSFNPQPQNTKNTPGSTSKINHILENLNRQNKKATAEVIKMHKYTEYIHIPPEIQKALTTLHIAYPYTWKDIKKQYHNMLKLHHPDNNTIQSNENVLNNRHNTIDEIVNSYNVLRKFYKK